MSRALRHLYARLQRHNPLGASWLAGSYAACRALIGPDLRRLPPIRCARPGPGPTILLVLDSAQLVQSAGNTTLIRGQIAALNGLGFTVDALAIHRAGRFHRLETQAEALADLGLSTIYETGPHVTLRTLLASLRRMRPAPEGQPHSVKVQLKASAAMPVPEALCSRAGAPHALLISHYVDHLPLARRVAGQAPVVVETHDIQRNAVAMSQARSASAAAEDLETEISALAEADGVVALSSEEADILAKRLGGDRVALIYPPGPAPAAPMPETQQNEAAEILFVGARHHPNREGLAWFVSQVGPRLATLVPEMRLRVLGTVVDDARQRGELASISAPWVDLTGRVADLAPYYAQARAVIVPILRGGGISIKTIEAMAQGRAVVSTSQGLRGFPSAPRYPAHDSPEAFAARLAELLRGPAARKEAEALSRSVVAAHFSPEVYAGRWAEELKKRGLSPNLTRSECA